MEICQGLGLALAVGIGGPVAALFIAMMGSLNAGIEGPHHRDEEGGDRPADPDGESQPQALADLHEYVHAGAG
jgi:hypothetical protein